MRYLSKVIYTLIVCNFIMAMCRRLVMAKSGRKPRFLLIAYMISHNAACIYGYADNPEKLKVLRMKMYQAGFDCRPHVPPLEIVQTVGTRCYRSIESSVFFCPCDVWHPCSCVWLNIAQKYGMTAEMLMHIVTEENNGGRR